MNPESVLPNADGASPVLTVSELNRAAARVLEGNFPLLWVRGEISNLTRAASGHWYFSIKDAQAQVRCVMFRSRAQLLSWQPREGDRVDVRARVSLYEARGDFQLGVETLRRTGAGDLFEAFLRLKARLEAEGLFHADRKRPIPAAPRAIGIVTSPQAAALRDVLATLRRRAPHVPVLLFPVPVQGSDAPGRLVSMLQRIAVRHPDDGVDVLLLVRGGGSIEDLWAFNDESLARTLARMPMPVISGIGHETDFTISDFVADLRAATPTAAAELAVPSRRDLLAHLARLAARLHRPMERRLDSQSQRLDELSVRLRPPSARLAEREAHLGWLARTLAAAMAKRLGSAAQRLDRAGWMLRPPDMTVPARRLDGLAQALQRQVHAMLEDRALRVQGAGRALALLGPQATLDRGYAIAQGHQGHVIRRAQDVEPGASVRVLLGSGSLDTIVADVTPAAAPPGDRADIGGRQTPQGPVKSD